MLYAVGILKTNAQLHIKFMGAIGSEYRFKPIAYNVQLLCEGRVFEILNLNKLLKMNNEQKPEFTLSSPAFAKQMLGDASGDFMSLHEQVMFDFHKKVWSDFDKKLREYVTKHLNDLGYQFATEDDFIEFVKARIYRIGFEDKPHYYELYLDFVDNENKGTFIGSYSDNVDITWNENTVTATIGRSIA